MTISPNSLLAHYTIGYKIGGGGMGEVYRARDEKLNRDVAIKVLPTAFARDEERLIRFKREAQVLASLNHTNIAAIYGLEDSNEILALENTASSPMLTVVESWFAEFKEKQKK